MTRWCEDSGRRSDKTIHQCEALGRGPFSRIARRKRPAVVPGTLSDGNEKQIVWSEKQIVWTEK